MFTIFFFNVAYGRGSVLLRWSDKISRRRGNLGDFFPIVHVLCSVAFETHTKTAELIEMPFGMMGGLGTRNRVYGTERGNFGGKRARHP